jgi:hypothetical protein
MANLPTRHPKPASSATVQFFGSISGSGCFNSVDQKSSMRSPRSCGTQRSGRLTGNPEVSADANCAVTVPDESGLKNRGEGTL